MQNPPTHSSTQFGSGVEAEAGPTNVGVQRWLDAEGRHFVLRPLGPEDSALLGRLWNEDLSQAARFKRFHASMGHFSPRRLRQLCAVPSSQGGAFLITHLLPDGEVAVAEGRWAWCPSTGSSTPRRRHTPRRWAALSVSVADRWQGKGLGRRLVRALTAAAQQQGAYGLRAQVLPGNGAMKALLAQAGYAHQGLDGACDHYTHMRVARCFNAAALAAALAAVAARITHAIRQGERWTQQVRVTGTHLLDRLTATVIARRLGWSLGQKQGLGDPDVPH